MLEEASSSAKSALAFASAAKGYGGQPSPPQSARHICSVQTAGWPANRSPQGEGWSGR
jgi:hypothetical protein